MEKIFKNGNRLSWKLWIVVKKNGISLVKKHCSQLIFQCALSNANWKHNAKEKWPLKVQLSIKEWKERSESWKNEKVYALVLPVCVRVWVLRWSDRENFLWQVSHWNGLTPTHTQEHTSVVTHTHTHTRRGRVQATVERPCQNVSEGKKHSYIKYVRPTPKENPSNTSANTCTKWLRKSSKCFHTLGTRVKINMNV